MNKLLKINTDNEQITLSARELHEFLEVGTQFKDWFPRMCEYGFDFGTDFNPLKIEQVRNEGNREVKRELQDYQITIDMAKEIAMLQRNEKGKEARQYFIQLEKEWNSPEKIMQRALVMANKQIGEFKFLIEQQKPKVDFYNAVAGSKDAVEMANVAKVLDIKGLGRNNLFQKLRDLKILQKNNIPYQEFVDRGYFRVVEQRYTTTLGETKITFKTLVYQRGIEFIKRKIEK